MSQETLDIYRDQRLEQIENGPFSEEFSIEFGGTFKGIFDLSHIEGKKDNADVTAKELYPRILVSEIPTELIGQEEQAKIQRETPEEIYTVRFFGKDAEGIPVIWLY